MDSKTYVILPTTGMPSKLMINDGDDELKKLQDVVGGWIEMVSLPGGNSIIVNEEGLLKRLGYNEFSSTIAGRHLVGDAVLVGPVDDEGDTGSVDEGIILYLTTMQYDDQEMEDAGESL